MNPSSLSLHEPFPEADAEQAAIRLDRMQTELRRGRPVIVASDDAAAPVLMLCAVETLSARQLHACMHSGEAPRLLLTEERLRSIARINASSDCSVQLDGLITVERLHRLAAVHPGASATMKPAELVGVQPIGPALQGALTQARRARLVPALLMIELHAAALPRLSQAEVMRILDSDLIAPARCEPGSARLLRVGNAHVPIAISEDCSVVLFREPHGEAEHLAIVVGEPDRTQPVLVRLHSACLTGDVFGSLRCDCGDQLRLALQHLASSGGVLLYLDQEGRSTGLANKLRAYRLQDAGLDTLDADRHLGFSADERDFSPAVDMLKQLGISRIRLLTNNPHKIEAMRRGGLEVANRVALLAPKNPHNTRYIHAKQKRAGHLTLGSMTRSAEQGESVVPPAKAEDVQPPHPAT